MAVAQLSTLGRFAMFALLPTNMLGWLKVLLFPFQVYSFTAIFVYLWLANHWPGDRWRTFSFEPVALRLALGYCVCFSVFMLVGMVQFILKRYSSSYQTFGLAVVSLLLGACCMPNYLRA